MAVREVKRQMRVLLFFMEAMFCISIGMSHPLVSWLPRHASALLSRYRQGTDGRTAEERRTGRSWRKPALQFGERLHAKPAVDKRGGAAPRLLEGHDVGHHERTGAVLCMMKDGVYFGTGPKQRDGAGPLVRGGAGCIARLPLGSCAWSRTDAR